MIDKSWESNRSIDEHDLLLQSTPKAWLAPVDTLPKKISFSLSKIVFVGKLLQRSIFGTPIVVKYFGVEFPLSLAKQDSLFLI